MAVRKINKEILKMHTLKTILRNDPKFSKYTDLPVRLKYGDVYVDATFIWSLFTRRYESKWTKEVRQVQHEAKDVAYVRNLCFDF